LREIRKRLLRIEQDKLLLIHCLKSLGLFALIVIIPVALIDLLFYHQLKLLDSITSYHVVHLFMGMWIGAQDGYRKGLRDYPKHLGPIVEKWGLSPNGTDPPIPKV